MIYCEGGGTVPIKEELGGSLVFSEVLLQIKAGKKISALSLSGKGQSKLQV